MKNHYGLKAVDLSWQKELDADPKAIQQVKIVGQLKDPDNATVCVNSFRKNQQKKMKVFSRKCNGIINNGKLSKSQR